MGLMDAIATLGLAGQGYNATDKQISERDLLELKRQREEEVNRIAIEQARRKEALDAGMRNAVTEVANRPAAMGLDIATMAPNDPYQEHALVTKGEAVPESPNVAGQVQAAQQYLSRQGELEASEKMRKVMKSLEDEGYKSIVVGIASGEDPKEIQKKFNNIGKERILGGVVDPGTGEYVFKMEGGEERRYNPTKVRGLATQMGFMEKPALHNAPAGSTVLQDGKPIYTAPNRPLKEEDPDLTAAKTAYYKAGTDLRGARGDLLDRTDPNLRGRGGAGAAGRPTPGAPGTTAFNNEVSKAAGDHATGEDLNGKKKVDYDRKNAIRSLAQKLAKEDPEAYSSASAAVDAAVEQLDGAKRKAETRARAELTDNPGANGTESVNAYVDRRTKELTKFYLKPEDKKKADEPAPEPKKTNKVMVPNGVATPKTVEELRALPAGTLYFNPADGKTYRKK
jgi:hypothetical protein